MYTLYLPNACMHTYMYTDVCVFNFEYQFIWLLIRTYTRMSFWVWEMGMPCLSQWPMANHWRTWAGVLYTYMFMYLTTCMLEERIWIWPCWREEFRLDHVVGRHIYIYDLVSPIFHDQREWGQFWFHLNSFTMFVTIKFGFWKKSIDVSSFHMHLNGHGQQC